MVPHIYFVIVRDHGFASAAGIKVAMCVAVWPQSTQDSLTPTPDQWRWFVAGVSYQPPPHGVRACRPQGGPSAITAGDSLAECALTHAAEEIPNAGKAPPLGYISRLSVTDRTFCPGGKIRELADGAISLSMAQEAVSILRGRHVRQGSNENC